MRVRAPEARRGEPREPHAPPRPVLRPTRAVSSLPRRAWPLRRWVVRCGAGARGSAPGVRCGELREPHAPPRPEGRPARRRLRPEGLGCCVVGLFQRDRPEPAEAGDGACRLRRRRVTGGRSAPACSPPEEGGSGGHRRGPPGCALEGRRLSAGAPPARRRPPLVPPQRCPEGVRVVGLLLAQPSSLSDWLPIVPAR